MCAEDGGVVSEGLKEREQHFTPCGSHHFSASLPHYCTTLENTAHKCCGSALHTDGTCTYNYPACAALCINDNKHTKNCRHALSILVLKYIQAVHTFSTKRQQY